MILLATNKRDITTDYIVAELRRRGLPFMRLNTEDVAHGELRMTIGGEWSLQLGLETLDLSQVTAAYYRRPESPRPREGVAAAAHADYCADEWSAVLRSFWNALEGRWFNSPFAIMRAEDKPRQLTVARSIGLRSPDTVITNARDAVLSLNASSIIAKPLRHALIEEGPVGQVIFTSVIADCETIDSNALGAAPVIFQQHLEKLADVRATVIDDRVFAVRIGSQEDEETRTDWRRGSNPELSHDPISLPMEVEAGCIEVVRRLGLRFAAIDLVHATDGDFWFLEANPNGQWAWIQNRTGCDIAGAIVDAMVRR